MGAPEDNDLRKELFALGEPNDDASLANARTLFAHVLDAKGGGLRILTIHAFAQSLLAAFPAEAGLVLGFRPLEGREEQLLARRTLADMLVRAEGEGDLGLVRDLQASAIGSGEGGAEAMLLACARAPAAMELLGPREGIEACLRRAFGLPAGDIDEIVAAACRDGEFDTGLLERIAAANRAWGTATASTAATSSLPGWPRSRPRAGQDWRRWLGIVLKKLASRAPSHRALIRPDAMERGSPSFLSTIPASVSRPAPRSAGSAASQFAMMSQQSSPVAVPQARFAAPMRSSKAVRIPRRGRPPPRSRPCRRPEVRRRGAGESRSPRGDRATPWRPERVRRPGALPRRRPRPADG